MNKHWLLAPKKSDNIIEQILINRGVAKQDWHDFLNPDFDKLQDPFKIKDLKTAVLRILKSIKDGETIGIFGDYDADGIPAAALLYLALTHLGARVCVYIPARERGYGLSKEGIEYLEACGARLVIAVDLGITARQEVAAAQKRGIDIIIIDHHTIQADKLPKAYAVVNPKRSDDRAPFRDYAACGLAYKFVTGLAQATEKISKLQLKWWLDLATISTVGDMVPLLGENRIITKFGLIVLAKTQRVGLKKLYERAAIDPEKISTSTVSFQIAPRLNSPGRMEKPGLPLGHVSPAFDLLITDDDKKAEVLAQELEQVNRQRQAILDKVVKEAKEKIEKEKLHQRKLILVAEKDWPAGVVGLVAGKIMEEYSRPTIILRKEAKVAKGSARSIEAFNIMEALDHVKEYLLKHGGHPRAAGLSFELKHMEAIYDKLLLLADQTLTAADLVPKIKIDADPQFADVSLGFVRRLRQLEPHGVGNPKPTILLKNLIVRESRTVGNDSKHLKLWLTGGDGSKVIGAIGFDLGKMVSQVKVGEAVDVVGYLDEDSWNGASRLQLKVIDLKRLKQL